MFKIEGPALIAFSGGRTSAYMLRRILDAHDNELPPDLFVVFADTGRELPPTYRFIDACAVRWGVTIHRVERAGGFQKLLEDKRVAGLREDGSFALPAPRNRYCTIELKKFAQWRFMIAQGIVEWTNVIGLRHDEPTRCARLREAQERRPVYPDGGETWLVGKEEATPLASVDCDYALPLDEAGVTEVDVMEFWAKQEFDLELGQFEGNCALCFMKANWKRVRVEADRPGLADWWEGWEDEAKRKFAHNAFSYKQVKVSAHAQRSQLSLPILDMTEEDLGACLCTD